MSYRKRGAHKKHPKTTNVRTIESVDAPGNRSTRRAGLRGGQGFGPLAIVRKVTAGPRRRSQDPVPWETGNTLGNSLMRNHEAQHRAVTPHLLSGRVAG